MVLPVVGVAVSLWDEENEKHAVPSDCPLIAPSGRAVTGTHSQCGASAFGVAVFICSLKHSTGEVGVVVDEMAVGIVVEGEAVAVDATEWSKAAANTADGAQMAVPVMTVRPTSKPMSRKRRRQDSIRAL
jgi:hypothetical protein